MANTLNSSDSSVAAAASAGYLSCESPAINPCNGVPDEFNAGLATRTEEQLPTDSSVRTQSRPALFQSPGLEHKTREGKTKANGLIISGGVDSDANFESESESFSSHLSTESHERGHFHNCDAISSVALSVEPLSRNTEIRDGGDERPSGIANRLLPHPVNIQELNRLSLKSEDCPLLEVAQAQKGDMALDTPSFRVAMMIKQTKHRIARLEGTSYAMVSETEVNSGFCCHTGTSSAAGLASLNIGWNDVIPRWKTGSILTFNGDRGSFLCDQDYQVACNALTQAAKRWNGEISRHVTLKPVEEHEPAVFQLVYRQDRVGGNGKTYATAFSPDTPPQCRKLFVYAKSFESDNVDFMTNIFYHEIGHILGLRHEFADVDTEERRTKSVPFGPKNELSVMNYFPHPRLIDIQPRDAEWVRKFYDYKHESYLELRVVDVPVEELGVTRQDVALLCY